VTCSDILLIEDTNWSGNPRLERGISWIIVNFLRRRNGHEQEFAPEPWKSLNHAISGGNPASGPLRGTAGQCGVCKYTYGHWSIAGLLYSHGKSCFYCVILSKTRPDVIARGGSFSPSKNPRRILVHPSLVRALLYHISPAARILESIIRKNTEPGRNNSTMSDGNGWGRIWQCYGDRKREGMWFETRRVP